jgi:hypothetical protein
MFVDDRVCTCTRCGRRYRYDYRRGHTKLVCNSCKTNQYRHVLKARLIELKGSGCEICGYSRCARALTFHHFDPRTKSFHFAGSHTRSAEMIEAELRKCILLCENCHREVEDGVTEIPVGVRARLEANLVGVPLKPPKRVGRPPLDPFERSAR